MLTYVSHGVCDLGIVGKDTIMEHGGSLLRGAGPGLWGLPVCPGGAGGQRLLRHLSRAGVVASKYPNVTKAYFAEKGMDVSVSSRSRAVWSWPPWWDLANGIVDIVQTGTTLKENGLTPIEDRGPGECPADCEYGQSMKLYQQEIFDLMDRMEAAKA